MTFSLTVSIEYEYWLFNLTKTLLLVVKLKCESTFETSRIQFWPASFFLSIQAKHAHAAWWYLRNTFLGAGASSPKSPQTLLPHSWAEGGGENRSDSLLWNVVPEESYFIQQEPSCSKTIPHGLFQRLPQQGISTNVKLKDLLIGSTWFPGDKPSLSVWPLQLSFQFFVGFMKSWRKLLGQNSLCSLWFCLCDSAQESFHLISLLSLVVQCLSGLTDALMLLPNTCWCMEYMTTTFGYFIFHFQALFFCCWTNIKS